MFQWTNGANLKVLCQNVVSYELRSQAEFHDVEF